MARSSGFQPRRAGPPEPNALKDWQCEYEDMMLNIYPERITELSPGSRSDSDDHPGLAGLLDWHPQRCARNVGVTTDSHALSDPLPGSNTPVCKVLRVFVAAAPRPGANLSDPCRDQESGRTDAESFKALRHSLQGDGGRWKRPLRFMAARRQPLQLPLRPLGGRIDLFEFATRARGRAKSRISLSAFLRPSRMAQGTPDIL
jgi:hypothetical protein